MPVVAVSLKKKSRAEVQIDRGRQRHHWIVRGDGNVMGIGDSCDLLLLQEPDDCADVVFFFKQKTAYEISTYWSSDVCSSDLTTYWADQGKFAVSAGERSVMEQMLGRLN